jgi:hypothetical protein
MSKQKNICDVGQSGQSKLCKCGHLKDEHEAQPLFIKCSHKDCECYISFE